MAFNFSNLADAKPTSSTSYLKPYQIYSNIEIKGTEIKEGTRQDGSTWKTLTITFGNDEGVFSHSMFYPDEKNPKDVNRPEFEQSNGGKRYGASAIEELQNQIASIGFAYFPDDFTKLQTMATKISTVEQLMTVFKKFVDNSIGKIKTNMKLVGRNSNGRIYAAFPKFTGIAEANTAEKASKNSVEVGEWYTWRISPFSDNPAKLAFSNYELTQAKNYSSATPTSVDKSNVDTDPINNFDISTDDDLASMLASL